MCTAINLTDTAHIFGRTLDLERSYGECVAIGMMAVCSGEVKERLAAVLERLGLPTEYNGDIDRACGYVSHDKKCDGAALSVVYVPNIGSFEIKKMPVDDFIKQVKNNTRDWRGK